MATIVQFFFENFERIVGLPWKLPAILQGLNFIIIIIIIISKSRSTILRFWNIFKNKEPVIINKIKYPPNTTVWYFFYR
jgi:hypothetical protein